MTVREPPGSAGIEGRLRAVILVCTGVTLSAVLWFALRPQPLHSDSFILVRGSSSLIDCVRAGRFTNCNGAVPHITNDPGEVGAFPLLQYIPSIALRAVGVSIASTLRVLALLSVGSLVAVLVLAYRTLRRVAPPLWAPLVTAALLGSPLLYYGRSSLGEALAAAVILAAVSAVLLDARPVSVLVLIVFACLTKETNPPFILVLAAICAIAPRRGTAEQRRRMLSVIVIGVASGVVLNAAFNVFRFGSWRNTEYMQSALENTKPSLIARLFVAQWFSPNGGLLWFWFLAPALVIGAAVLASSRPQWNIQGLAAPVVALLLVGQMLLLSTWWQPFGWYAWGPRLVLPLLPALMVAGSALAAPYATAAMARILRSRAFVPLVLAAIASGIAQVAVLFNLRAVSKFFSPVANFCAGTGSGPGSNRYYNCLLKTAWSKQPWMLRLGLDGLTNPWGVLVATALAGAVALLFYAARRAAADEAPDYSSEPFAGSDELVDAGTGSAIEVADARP